MLRILVDGSCKGNPGPIGWAAVIVRDGDVLHRVSEGSAEQGTNNLAEMQAVLLGLSSAFPSLEDDENIVIVSDSELAIGLMSKGWRSKSEHLLLLRHQIRQAERALGHQVSYEKGSVKDDELFQLVDVMAKNAVPAGYDHVALEKLMREAIPEGLGAQPG